MNKKQGIDWDKTCFQIGSITHSIWWFITGKIPFKLFRIYLSKDFLEKEYRSYKEDGVL